MYKIFLVEDDPAITQVLERQLTKWGYLVGTVADFQRVLEEFEAFQPHLVLLDISLPFYNGYHWCGEIRKVSQAPILFLSSAGDEMNLIMAINLGADDFVAKPFSLEVITAKIQAMLRRAYAFGGEVNVIHWGDLALNLGDSTLLWGQEKLELTKNECRMVQMLLEARGNIVTRDAIIQRLWESESFIDDNTLTVNVARLRKKLDTIGLGSLIATKKGVGYALEAVE